MQAGEFKKLKSASRPIKKGNFQCFDDDLTLTMDEAEPKTLQVMNSDK